MRRLYEKKYNPLTEIDEGLFNEFWDIYNQGTDEGFNLFPQAGTVSPDNDFLDEIHHNNGVFAAFKTHRFQNDMAAMLTDENGKLKSFASWERDTTSIRDHHVRHWLETEYNTAVRRAHLAAEWRQFEREKEILPNLEWIKTTAVTPGKDHEPFWGVILPIEHAFWNDHRPGDRWGCKCGLRNTDKPERPPKKTDWDNPIYAPAKGLDNNPGKDAMMFSFSHPYFVLGYLVYKKLAPIVKKFVNKQVEKRRELKQYKPDSEVGKKLLIHQNADKTELQDNVRTGRALIENYPKMSIRIREHVRNESSPKNPEYEINGLIADAKRVEGAKGIAAGFSKAIKQGCRIVVIDFDKHFSGKPIYYPEISKRISWREKDFTDGVIKECYIIHNNKAVKITKENCSDREWIEQALKKSGM